MQAMISFASLAKEAALKPVFLRILTEALTARLRTGAVCTYTRALIVRLRRRNKVTTIPRLSPQIHGQPLATSRRMLRVMPSMLIA